MTQTLTFPERFHPLETQAHALYLQLEDPLPETLNLGGLLDVLVLADRYQRTQAAWLQELGLDAAAALHVQTSAALREIAERLARCRPVEAPAILSAEGAVAGPPQTVRELLDRMRGVRIV